MYNCDVTLRLKELSPTTEEDVDLDLLDQELFWLGLGNIFITNKVSHENVVIKSEPEIRQPEENRSSSLQRFLGEIP